MSTTVQQNKTTFTEFQRALGRQDWSDATLSQFVAPDVVDHSAAPGARQGLAGLRERLEEWHAAFGDAVEINLASVGQNDELSVLYETRARHVGTFMGIRPTNRRVTIPGIRFARFEDGRIAEIWGIYDYFTTALEIGSMLSMTPNAGAAPAVRAPGTPRLVPKKADAATLGTGPTAVNTALLLHFREDVFNANDWSTANLARFLRADIIDHNAFPGDPPGLEGVRVRFSMWRDSFDDASEEYQAIVGESDLLAVRYDLHATHTGEFLGIPPSGRRVNIPGIEFLRFEDGLIAEHWGIYDFQATARQIGASLNLTPRETALPPRPQHPHARFAPLGLRQ
jgi:predicted ester cyclase